MPSHPTIRPMNEIPKIVSHKTRLVSFPVWGGSFFDLSALFGVEVFVGLFEVVMFVGLFEVVVFVGLFESVVLVGVLELMGVVTLVRTVESVFFFH